VSHVVMQLPSVGCGGGGTCVLGVWGGGQGCAAKRGGCLGSSIRVLDSGPHIDRGLVGAFHCYM
jgi:hypothetical protein